MIWTLPRGSIEFVQPPETKRQPKSLLAVKPLACHHFGSTRERQVKWLICFMFLSALALLLWRNWPEREARGRTTIRYMAWGNPEQLEAEKELIAEFERRRPDIRVKLTLIPGSAYYQKLQVMLASGTAPDIFRCDHYLFPAYAHRGYFMPLTDFVAGDKDFRLADYFESTVREGMYKDEFYGPNTLFGARVVYYNKDAFERYNREAPDGAKLTDPYVLYKRGEWTLEQFLDAARKLTRFDAKGLPTQFGALIGGLDAWTFIRSFGGDILTPDGTRCIVDTPEAIRGLRFVQDLVHKWHVMPQAAEGALHAYTFESDRIAMVFGWAGESPRYRANCRFKWDVVSIPSGPAGRIPMLKGNQLLMYRRTKVPRQAWEFQKFYASHDAEMILCARLRRGMPTRKDVVNSPEYLQSDRPPFQNDVWRDQYAMGRKLPITDRWASWQSAWNQLFELLLLNRITPEELARRATGSINRILAEEPY
jgi:multiple sugar transport system substrate-binding protein